MPRAATTEYFSGQGIVYLATRNSTTGAAEGFVDVGNVSDLKVSFKTDTLDHKESRTGQRLIDKRMTTGKTADAAFTLDSFSADTLGKAMFSTNTAVPLSASATESIVARLGKVVPLSKIKVNTVVVKNAGGSVTYLEGKNYTIDEAAGSIYFFTTAEATAQSAVAQITDAATCDITLKYAAQTLIETFQNSETEYTLRFEGLNTAQDNSPVIVTIWKFRPNPLKDLSLITNDLNKFEMDGAVLMDTSNGNKFVTIQKL
jgi:hypothetical protein